MSKKTTKITELVISEENEALAIDAISLVTSPAIEVDFVYFNKSKNNLTFAKVDEEKRELISPALIPNKQIYRYDANTDSEYYVYFSKDTVKKAAYSYLKHNNHHKATYQHEQRVAGVLTVESWIKEGDQDKSKLYGFDLANGTWFVKMKIENEDLWQRIKAGEIKGLSIEGYFIDKLEQMGNQYTDEEIRKAYKELQAEGKIKVELSLKKDLEKTSKVLEQIIKEQEFEISESKNYVSDLNSAAFVVKEMKSKSKLLNKKISEHGDTIRKMEKALKDLGVNPQNQDTIIKADRLIQKGFDARKKIGTATDKIIEAAKKIK